MAKSKKMMDAPVQAPVGKHEEDYEAESAAHDLMRAEKHKSNPDLMKRVHKHLKKKTKAIKSIQDLVNARNSMMTEKEDPDADSEEMEPAHKSKKA